MAASNSLGFYDSFIEEMFIGCPLDPSLSLIYCGLPIFLSEAGFPHITFECWASGPLRARPALTGCLVLNGIKRTAQAHAIPPRPPPSPASSHTAQNLAELGLNELLLAWEAV